MQREGNYGGGWRGESYADKASVVLLWKTRVRVQEEQQLSARTRHPSVHARPAPGRCVDHSRAGSGRVRPRIVCGATISNNHLHRRYVCLWSHHCIVCGATISNKVMFARQGRSNCLCDAAALVEGGYDHGKQTARSYAAGRCRESTLLGERSCTDRSSWRCKAAPKSGHKQVRRDPADPEEVV